MPNTVMQVPGEQLLQVHVVSRSNVTVKCTSLNADELLKNTRTCSFAAMKHTPTIHQLLSLI